MGTRWQVFVDFLRTGNYYTIRECVCVCVMSIANSISAVKGRRLEGLFVNGELDSLT